MRHFVWRCGRHTFEIDARPLVMGVLNVTPDSFSDGGRFRSTEAALAQARRLIEEGADILDVGGESSRPGAEAVSASEQLRRILPVVRVIAAESNVAISIDTTCPEVAHACLAEGASIVNDISGLTADTGMIAVVGDHHAGIVAMHMKGTPRTMQTEPRYDDVVGEVSGFFADRLRDLQAAGIDAESVAIDPGIGFGKTTEHNLALLANLDAFRHLDRPLCLGVSRKRFIGEITGRDVHGRLAGSLAVASFAMATRAVQIVRVHDVAQTRDAALLAASIARHQICR